MIGLYIFFVEKTVISGKLKKEVIQVLSLRQNCIESCQSSLKKADIYEIT